MTQGTDTPVMPIREFDSPADAELELYCLLRRILEGQERFCQREPRVVMVSGGSSPSRVYALLGDNAAGPSEPDTACCSTRVILADERIVEYGSPNANRTALEPVLSRWKIPEDHAVFPELECEPEISASTYSARLCTLFTSRVVPCLAVLGIGSDGHTASIFPGHEPDTALYEPVRFSYPNFSGSPEKEHGQCPPLAFSVRSVAGFDRVSVTPGLILGFERIIFFAPGSAKKDIIAEILGNPRNFPAGMIGSLHSNAEIWMASE
jgi:6-phosphogluconolactonase/glucosamine-6-phosphate isomerase/deaminase